MALRRPFAANTVRLRSEELETREVPAFYAVQGFNDTNAPSTAPLGGDGSAATPFLMDTLRSAVVAANQTAANDTIILQAGTFNLTYGGPGENFGYSGDLDVFSASTYGTLTVNGAGASTVVRGYGGFNDRIFDVQVGGNLTLNNLTLSNGFVPTGYGDGGAIAAYNSTLTINASTLTNNQTYGGSGGAIAFTGGFQTLTITDSEISNNRAARDGGGISINSYGGTFDLTRSRVDGNQIVGFLGAAGGGIAVLTTTTTTVTDSTISNNAAYGIIFYGGAGGGVYTRGPLALVRSTVYGNVVTGGDATGAGLTIGGDARGGGVYFDPSSGTLTITNSTVSGNRVAGGNATTTITGAFAYGGNAEGGGVYAASGTVTVRNSTITLNNATGGTATAPDGSFPGGSAGGGVSTASKLPFSVGSTIVAGNTLGGFATIGVGPDVFGTFTSAGSNLIGDVTDSGPTGFVNGTSGDIVGGEGNPVIDPLLGPLADNGGPTFTHALLAGSPAIKAGSNLLSLTTDQRGDGFPRSFGGATDIGAVEFQPVEPPPPPPAVSTFRTAVGSGSGQASVVKVYDTAGDQIFTLNPYEPTYTGGVNVATGDLNGDGIEDIVTGALSGGGPRVVVFDGATGAVLRDFFAFEAFERGGVFVAIGDADGDGDNDIITGAGVGGGPRVRAFNFADLATVQSYFAFDDTEFRGGVTVAFAGGAIIAGRGPGGTAEVSVFDVAGGAFTIFAAYESSYTGGVYVAAGPGIVVTGPWTGSPRARVFTLAGTSAGFPDFLAFDGQGDGLRVGTGGTATVPTLLLGYGGGPGLTGNDVNEFFADQTALPGFNAFDPDPAGGVFVG